MPNIFKDMFSGGEVRTHKGLMRYCDKGHEACRRSQSKDGDPFMPTRFIDLRSYPQIRLVSKATVSRDHNTNDDGDAGTDWRYIALSYCWGSSMPESGKTTTKNKAAREQYVDVRTLHLPKTLRDAVDFTHSLGIPYLWIDALCIVQDDMVDWEREALLMGSIYSFSELTVAAAVSDHCDAGFLKTSYSSKELPKVPREDPNDLNRAINIDLKVAEMTNRWLHLFVQNPLFARGWTLQERELSPRVLHFTRTHIVWECREIVCAYLRPHMGWLLRSPRLMPLYPDHYTVVWPFRSLDLPSDGKGFTYRPSGRQRGARSVSSCFIMWHQIVENYSQRRLTVPTDKIPAIAGVAKTLQAEIRCEFLGGLWRDNLLNDLLWWRANSTTTHPEQDLAKYYAPSWSWMSTNFPLCYTSRNDANDAEILEAIVRPANVISVMESGLLRLRARVLDIQEKQARFRLDSGDHVYATENKRTVCVLKTGQTVEAKWGGREGQHLVQRPWAGGGVGLIIASLENEQTYKRIGYVEDVPWRLLQETKYKEVVIL